nr:MFS transporter [Desulfonispora thiosulfatigenes]
MSLVNLFIFTSFYFLLPTLPIYVIDVLHGDEGNVGYIVGTLTIAAVLVRPLSGYLLDTLSRKRILIIALIAFTVTTLAYNFVTSLVMLLILRAVHGFSWGFVTTGSGTIASDIVPASRRGEGMGYYGLANTIAMAVGPMLSLFILDYYGFSYLFSSGFVIAIFALLCVLGIQGYEGNPNQGREKPTISLESFLEPRAYSLSIVLFFVTLTYGGIISFITLYAGQLGIQNAGIFFLIYGASLLFVRPYAGKTFDKKGPNQIMIIGFIALVVSFTMLYLANGYLLFVLAAISMGIGFGIIQPTILAMAINRVEPFRRGAVNGTIFTAMDLGIGLGSIVMGLLSNKLGLSLMYLVCAFLIIIPAIIFYLKDADKKNTNYN